MIVKMPARPPKVIERIVTAVTDLLCCQTLSKEDDKKGERD